MGTNASRDQQYVTKQYDIDGYRDMLTTPEMTDRYIGIGEKQESVTRLIDVPTRLIQLAEQR